MEKEKEIKSLISEVKHAKAKEWLEGIFEFMKEKDTLMVKVFIDVLCKEVASIKGTKEFEYIDNVLLIMMTSYFVSLKS